MSRRRRAEKRIVAPDPKFNSTDLVRFTNKLMEGGNKSVVQKIIYDVLDELEKKTKKPGKEVFDEARKEGFVRIRLNGTIQDLSDSFNLNKYKWNTIEIVVDRLVIEKEMDSGRLTDSIETALHHGGGTVSILDAETREEQLFSEHFACVNCDISLGEIEPRTFSFNSPYGACANCTGLGFRLEIDPNLVIPNKDLSLREGAIQPWRRVGSITTLYWSLLESLARENGFSTATPVKDLESRFLDMILYGNGGKSIELIHTTRRGRTYRWKTTFEGVITNLVRRHKETPSDYMRRQIERYMTSHLVSIKICVISFTYQRMKLNSLSFN